MTELTKWQTVSFASRGVAMALGLVQSFFIVRILSVGEWGLVQIAVSIGGAFGIYQHLGLASGSTREISAAKNDTQVFKIFVTAGMIRYLVTIPIAISLFFWAESIAVGRYNESALVLPLKIYAVVLLFQGVQSILNSVIAGTKRFKNLFIYQSVIAGVSLLIYIPLVYLFKINGYFYALIAFNVVSSLTLAVLAFRPLQFEFEFPSRQEFRSLLGELLSISLAIYAVKVIYTMWEKSGPILLGLEVSKEAVGIFAFALLYGKKLVSISDAVTVVNLPVLSEKFVHNLEEFKQLFTRNFDKVFTIILFCAFSAIFWSWELTYILVGGNKYEQSIPFILPMVFAFVFYALLNIITSSVVVPAKLVKELILGFVGMIVTTIGVYFLSRGYWGHLQAMTYAMALGGLLGFAGLSWISQKRLNFKFINHDHLLILLQIFVVSLISVDLATWVKFILYPLFLGLFTWAIFTAGFFSREDVEAIKAKLTGFRNKSLPA